MVSPFASLPHPPAHLTPENWDTVLQSGQPVVVYFWAPWCGVGPGLEARLVPFLSHFAGKVTFARVNADEFPELAARHFLTFLPSLLIFSAGTIVAPLLSIANVPNDLRRHLYRLIGR
jgi:thioredoxin 1